MIRQDSTRERFKIVKNFLWNNKHVRVILVSSDVLEWNYWCLPVSLRKWHLFIYFVLFSNLYVIKLYDKHNFISTLLKRTKYYSSRNGPCYSHKHKSNYPTSKNSVDSSPPPFGLWSVQFLYFNKWCCHSKSLNPGYCEPPWYYHLYNFHFRPQ